MDGELRPRPLGEMEPAALIVEARRSASLTQAELASRLGTTQSAISRWERGHDEPRLARLADVLAACAIRATVSFVTDDGVDRAQLRQQLAMTPDQRLASVVNVSLLVAGSRRA